MTGIVGTIKIIMLISNGEEEVILCTSDFKNVIHEALVNLEKIFCHQTGINKKLRREINISKINFPE